MNPAYIISTASLVICVFFFFYFRSFLKRRTAVEELLAEYRTEVYRLIAEIDVATDRDSRLVEERIKSLKTLLEDTDKRIAVYLRELDRSRSGEALYTSLGRGIRAAIGSQPVQQPPAPTPGQTPIAVMPVTPADPKAVSEHSKTVVSAADPAAKKQLGEQVAELTAQGLSPAEIASRLGISFSEVDLVLNLFNLRSGKVKLANGSPRPY